MKFVSSKLIIFIVLIVIASVFSKNHKGKKTHLRHKAQNKHVNLVQDTTGFGSDLGVVIRKTPTVFTDNRLGLARLEPPQEFNTFSNSNTSDLPNVGGYGRTAEIVNPTILFHSKSPTTLVKTTPAHLGYRNEKTSITSFNKQTGKTETHDVVQRKPVYGEIESVKTMEVDTIRPLDLQYRRFRKARNVVQENPELNFNRNPNFISE